MKPLDIGVLSKRSGVPPSTLRYYEEIGLIQSAGRHGLRRQFDLIGKDGGIFARRDQEHVCQ
jgi:hypothetical protein